MREIVSSIEGECNRYKRLGEAAIRQLNDEELSRGGSETTNSVAMLVWHISGNLKSRFTDFLTSDGEKPWRRRDSEFESRSVTSEELFEKWNEGWKTAFDALANLSDNDLGKTVFIRGVSHKVHEALHRSMAHASYHVGQIVCLAKQFRGADWKNLSIALGKSTAYNKNPTREKPL
jgi:uncharacterized damage-inducible protein DinB